MWSAGCDDNVASTAATNSPATTIKTATQTGTAATTKTVTNTTAAIPDGTPASEPDSGQNNAPAPAPQPLVIVEQSVSPTTVIKGGTVTFTVKVTGNAKSVTMLFGQAGGDVATAYSTISLQPAGTIAGVTTWTQQATVNMNGTGTRTFFFKATALTQDNLEVKTPGNPEAYQTFTVHS